MSEASLRPADAPAGIYGPDGRPQFFNDPAMDRFVSVLLNLTSEVWAQAERIETLEALLAEKGVVTGEERTALVARAETDAAREEALRAFIQRTLTPLREA